LEGFAQSWARLVLQLKEAGPDSSATCGTVAPPYPRLSFLASGWSGRRLEGTLIAWACFAADEN
jgi:hypothetical protein